MLLMAGRKHTAMSEAPEALALTGGAGGGAGRVSVLLPVPLNGPLDYLVPAHLVPDGGKLPAGTIVMVPLGGRRVVGVVWDSPASGGVASSKLRPIHEVLDLPPLPDDVRRFVAWVARYTMSNPGEVLAMAVRPSVVIAPPGRLGWRGVASVDAASLGEKQRKVLEAALAAPGSLTDLAKRAGVSVPVVSAMAKTGLLESARLEAAPRFGGNSGSGTGEAPTLSEAQAEAGAALAGKVTERKFGVTLLEGVTGSGKTEVYFEAIEACRRAGRVALVLLPEIALSAQWLERFVRRFGLRPLVWHSDLGQRDRRLAWSAIAHGRADVIVGARSALFLPIHDLGLVIVDEEHESAFKQEEGVIYHARDMAVVRGQLAGAPVVLVSATPSLETLNNAQSGRYDHLRLDARHGGALLPAVEVVDMRSDPPDRGKFLSPRLIESLRAVLGRQEQGMLFLNRRGYAPLTLCRTCGHRLQCPNCTAWLVEHRARRQLACHHCGYFEAAPSACPSCGVAGSLVPIGPGIERISEEALEAFPEARILVMASDTLTGPNAAGEAAQAIVDRRVDLIIGTQIVAKGWHFPHLTLVGVVDADIGLAGGDLRAGERTLQLLHQVAGRAGRAEAPGRVMLQTFSPDHPVMQALLDGRADEFMDREAAARRPGHWPPFGRLVALIVSSVDAPSADRVARDLGRAAPRGPGITVLGPAPAPLAILRNRHRRRLLLKTTREIAPQNLVHAWVEGVDIPRNVTVDIDVDPVSFL